MQMDAGEDLAWVGWAIMDQAFRVIAGVPPVHSEHTALRVFDDTDVRQAGTPPRVDQGYGTAYVAGYERLWARAASRAPDRAAIGRRGPAYLKAVRWRAGARRREHRRAARRGPRSAGGDGSGKSTWSTSSPAITRRSPAASLIDGRTVDLPLRPAHASKRGLGVVDQDLRLIPSLSVAETFGSPSSRRRHRHSSTGGGSAV